MASSVWATVDMLTVVVAAMLALRFRVVTPPDVSTMHVLPHLIQSSPGLLSFYIGWFGICLVFFTRSYGLYGPIQNRSGLHEQRMTVQAALTSGLLLCGTLYLSNGRGDFAGCRCSDGGVYNEPAVPAAGVVAKDGVPALPGWDRDAKCVDRRFGPGGSALRNHIDTLQHLGFRLRVLSR